MTVACPWIDLIPPSQPNQTTSGNVFDVIEVRRKKEDGDDEDQDEVFCEL